MERNKICINTISFGNSFYYTLRIFLIFSLIELAFNLCDRETPILLDNGTCVSIPCISNQSSLGECIINNDIIKTQWLNNIIIIGNDKSMYIKFAEYSNEDLVILVEDDIGSLYRFFYGIKQNGRPLFTDSNNDETPYKFMTAEKGNNGHTERDVCIITTNSNKEEYLINIGKNINGSIELFDFESDEIYTKSTAEFIGGDIYNSIGTCINTKKDNAFYFLHGSLEYNKDRSTMNNNPLFFNLRKYYFNTKESIKNDPDILKFYSNNFLSYYDVISCFETSLNNIVCFYCNKTKIDGKTTKNYYIIAFDDNLLEKNITEKIENPEVNFLIFFKCLHYKDEAGAFVFYIPDENNENILYPCFFFKNLTSTEFINSFPEINEIIIDIDDIEIYTYLSDFIKLSENKFVLSTIGPKTKVINIILLNIFQHNGNKIKIRIYKIKTLELYNFQPNKNIRMYPYKKNILALGINFVNETCIPECSQLFIGAFFISYPNSKDINMNIIDELFENNFLTIDFKKNVTIENNLFGLIFSSIIIKKFENCENLKFFSSTENKEITPLYKLKKNENVIAKLNYVEYENIQCRIEYAYEATEPDYEEFDKYPSIVNNTFGEDKDIFDQQKEKYEGRTSYYNLTLNEKLSNDCSDINCGLCLTDKITCIVCRYNFTLKNDSDGKIHKNCLERKEYEESSKEKKEYFNEEKELIEEEDEYFNEEENNYYKDEEKSNEEENANFKEEEEENKRGNKSYMEEEDKNYFNEEEESNKGENELYKEEEESNKGENKSRKEEEELNKKDNKSYKEEEESNKEGNEPNKEEEELNKRDNEPNKEEEESNIRNNELYKEEEMNEKENQIKISDKLINEDSSNVESSIIREEEKEIIKKAEKPIKKICNNSEILNNNCQDGTMTNEQFNDLSKEIEKKYINNETYEGDNIIIITDNVIFQISKSIDQKNNSKNISSIDLGECETKLKEYYSIDKDEPLIIYKQDIRIDDLSTTYVQYKIYHPFTLVQLNLSICTNEQIKLYVPVNLEEETLSLYNSLNESGYNLFDANDAFYNDICTPYTTENGTDISLFDRKEIIVDLGNNMNLCQTACTLKSYDTSTNKATCICYIEYNQIETNFDDLGVESFIKDFIYTLKYSNYLVLKCYKLIGDYENLKQNFGFIIMLIILSLFIIAILVYIFTDQKKIEYFINSIIRSKELNKVQKSSSKSIPIKGSNNNSDESQNDESSKKNKDSQKELLKLAKDQKENNHESKNINSQEPPIKKKNKLRTSYSRSKKRNKENIKKALNSESLKMSNDELISKNKKNRSRNINNLYRDSYTKDIRNNSTSKIFKLGENNIEVYKNSKFAEKKDRDNFKKSKLSQYLDKDDIIFSNLTTRELNELDYKNAIEIDKRTFLQYYCSLLKRNELILFTFISNDDYNLFTLKLCLFFISFSLFMIVDAFFFSKDKIHEIYKRNGVYDLILQIPQILYSAIISTTINTILKLFSLSENKILSIKKEKNLNNCYIMAKGAKKHIIIKSIIFIVISLCCIVFFWYFLSCFCAVYVNTQAILIKDSILSFCLSMIYPFGLCLLPGVFRIAALRAKKHDKEILYKFSNFISLL